MVKKYLRLFLIAMVFLLVSACSFDGYQALDYYYGNYRVYYQSHGSCEMYVTEVIYEDDENTYLLASGGCSVDHYYYIRYDQEFVDIPAAIDQGIITIEQVLASSDNLLIEPKE